MQARASVMWDKAELKGRRRKTRIEEEGERTAGHSRIRHPSFAASRPACAGGIVRISRPAQRAGRRRAQDSTETREGSQYATQHTAQLEVMLVATDLERPRSYVSAQCVSYALDLHLDKQDPLVVLLLLLCRLRPRRIAGSAFAFTLVET